MKDMILQMAETFKALGEPNRLKIIKMLASNPERSLCVGCLAERLGITQPAVSQHLKVLKNAGLVEPNRNGYRVHYTINMERFSEFMKNSDELYQLAFEQCSGEKECQKRPA
jgi:ArsR family transcriptional regulator